MASNRAEFKEWLSGECACGDPPYWKCKISQDRIEIVPSWRMTVIGFVVLLIFTAGGGGLFWDMARDAYHDYSRDHSVGIEMAFPAVGMFISGAVMLIGGGAGGVILVSSLSERFKGPYFFYTSRDKQLAVPRDSLRVPKANVVGWRVVSGNWIGPQGAQKFQEFPISELQLIVKMPAGLMAFAVAGAAARSNYSTTDRFQKIAETTHLPLESVQQHQGITQRPNSTRDWPPP